MFFIKNMIKGHHSIC